MKTDVSPESRFTRAPDVLVKILDDEAVLLNKVTGSFHSMNRVGTFIWQVLADGVTFCKLSRRVSEQFNVSRAEAEADARTFLEGLLDRGLVMEC